MTNNASKLVEELKKTKLAFDFSTMSDPESPVNIKDWLSTGSVVLDTIMGNGLPAGRIVEIHGDNSSGKSLIASQCVAKMQRDYPDCLINYFDTEHAVGKTIMESIGVDFDNIVLSSPDTIEEVFDAMEKTITIRNISMPGAKILLIWDSIGASSTMAEETNDFGKATMGKHAQLISQGMRKLGGLIAKNGVFALFLNQTRDKIGVMFGDPTTTFGGHAMEFHCTIRVQLKNRKKIKDGLHIIGSNTEAIVIKNRIVAPYQKAMLPIYFGGGINDCEAIREYLKATGELEGSTYLTIPGIPEVEKFKANQWDKVFEKHYEQFVELVKKADNTKIALPGEEKEASNEPE